MSVEEKYSGCNVVETTVTQKRAQPTKKRKTFFWVRLGIAAALTAGIVGLRYIHSPTGLTVRAAVKSVVCYDVFGRTDIGCSAYFDEKKRQ